MVDSDAVRQDPEQAYRAAILKTSVFHRMLENAAIDGPVWPEDASPYRAHQFAADRWLLAGDSGCFGDPAAWTGLERALESAYNGAELISARLDHPEYAEAAARYYDERERRIYADHIRRAAERYAAAEPYHGTRFWRDRRRPPQELAIPRADELRREIETLRGSRNIRPRSAEVIRIEERVALRTGEITLAPTPVIPVLSPETEQLDGVHLPALASLAGQNHTAPALLQAYNRTQAPASEDAIERALGFLVALGVLAVDP